MNKHSVILEVMARPLYLLIIAASLWVLVRGHNEPGGGFIGGLVAVSATVLWAFAKGGKSAALRLPWRSPLTLATVGFGVAALAGLPAFFIGKDYLTHLWGIIPLGLFDLKVSSVLLFDFGIYLCVWGSLSGYILALLALDQEDSGADRQSQEEQG